MKGMGEPAPRPLPGRTMPDRKPRVPAHPRAQKGRLFIEKHLRLVGDSRQPLAAVRVGHRGQSAAGLVRQGLGRELDVMLRDLADRSLESDRGEMFEFDVDALAGLDVAAVSL